MRKRLTVEGGGLKLKTADGKVVAEVVSMTLDFLESDVLHDQQDELPGASKFDPVPVIWEHYVQVMNPRSKGLDAQTRAVIREALKVATLDECRRAITGCKASDFHMGVNERRKKYNRITHILKGKRGGKTTREQIDLFLDIAEKAGDGGAVTSGDSARINDAKRDVLAAAEFPSDEHAVQRGTEARQWLVDHGWTIGADETAWPTFTPPP